MRSAREFAGSQRRSATGETAVKGLILLLEQLAMRLCDCRISDIHTA